jgi:hypothetical protein
LKKKCLTIASSRQSALPIQSTVYYSAQSSCSNAQVVSEARYDMTRFPGGQCFGSGACSLTAQTQADNTVMRVTSCAAAPIQGSSLPLHVSLYSDSSCTRMNAANGYINGCYPGTLNGASQGGSTRTLCDGSGNIYQVIYTDGTCAGTPKSCALLHTGPANTCVSSVEDPSSFQIVTCSASSTVPSICPAAGRAPPTTTAAPTARPAANLDINRDGKIDILDVAVLLDAYGLCPTGGAACPADVAVPYGRVDSYDLTALLNAMPRK